MSGAGWLPKIEIEEVTAGPKRKMIDTLPELIFLGSSMRFSHSILDLIGHTPLVKLSKMVPPSGPTILAKMECANPGGSVKDRMVWHIVREAERAGQLQPGDTIVDNTSGNTGIGLALVAAVRGYHAVLAVPDRVSQEKIDLLTALGAEVIVTPAEVPVDDAKSYYQTAQRLARERGAFNLNQYHNPKNPEAHYLTTGPEIWEDTEGKIDVLVAGIGTGGTITGIARFLKEKKPQIKVIGVDPVGSIHAEYIRTGKLAAPEPYLLEGIGSEMVTQALDPGIVDTVLQVTDREAFLMVRKLAQKEGLLVGGSSGAAFWAALKVARGIDSRCLIVTIFPDSGTRYLSKYFNDEWMRSLGFLAPPPGQKSRAPATVSSP